MNPIVKSMAGVSILLAIGSCSMLPEKNSLIDCPLRDEPYSVESPMMDIMLNPAVETILKAEMPRLMKSIPPMFLESEAPSLSAIMTLEGSAELLRMPLDEGQVKALNKKLAAVKLTDQDREARCARYDNEEPGFVLKKAEKQILVFTKFNGYGHESTPVTTNAITDIADSLGWGVVVTDKAGAFTPAQLKQFDVVVWNNVSGDVLTLSQRKAFEKYINKGGGFFGIHGSGGDFMYLWDWYLDELLGAQFIGHTMDPHYQDATVNMESTDTGIDRGLSRQWTVHDEWYSFSENPREKGFDIIATVDEKSYLPEMSGISLRMGEDHPIAWSRCVGQGRSFYSAIGHLPEVYNNQQNLLLLKNALLWAAGAGGSGCAK